MEAKTVCGRRAGGDYGHRHVPAVAREAAHWRVVSEHGHAGTDRAVLCHGDFPTHSVLRHGLHGQAWTMAISESIRGRRILR